MRAMTSGAPSRASADFMRMRKVSSGARLAVRLEALVEIAADRLHQRIDLSIEKVIGARDHLLLDHDALLRLELLDEAADVLVRHHRVLIAMNDHAGGWAGRQERKIVEIGWRGDRDEALDLRPAHEQLHADPGAEGEAGDPAAPRLRVDRLRPVERRGGIRQLALAVIERALAAPNPAEIEAQHGKAPVHEGIIDLIDDLVVHRAPELGMGMEHDADRGVALSRLVVTALDAPGGAGEDDLGHERPRLDG